MRHQLLLSKTGILNFWWQGTEHQQKGWWGNKQQLQKLGYGGCKMHSNQKQTPTFTKNKLQNKRHNTNAPVSLMVGGRSRQA